MRQHQSLKERKKIFFWIFSRKNIFFFAECENEIIWELQKWFEFKSAGLHRNVSNLFFLKKRAFREKININIDATTPEFE